MAEIQNIQIFDEEDIKKRGRPPLPQKATNKKDRRLSYRKIYKRNGKTINDSYGNCENRDDYIFAMHAVTRHEDKGIYYLKYLGYKNSDIRKNNGGDGIADLSTMSDDQDWEVKIVGSSKSVGFTYEQIKNMRKDTNVLIFGTHGYPDVLKFDDILSGKYKNKYNFIVNILLPLSAAINMTKYIEEEKERDVV